MAATLLDFELPFSSNFLVRAHAAPFSGLQEALKAFPVPTQLYSVCVSPDHPALAKAGKMRSSQGERLRWAEPSPAAAFWSPDATPGSATRTPPLCSSLARPDRSPSQPRTPSTGAAAVQAPFPIAPVPFVQLSRAWATQAAGAVWTQLSPAHSPSPGGLQAP